MEEKAPTHQEQKKFLNTKYMQKVISEVTSRLGYESQLSFEIIKNLHSYCAYENAWSVNSKPGFCTAFTPEHLKILEYNEDLSYYYGYGYRNQTARRMACPVVQDLFKKLTHASGCSDCKKASCNKGVFYVSHTETLLPTYALLKLFKIDRPLLHDNYEYQSERSYKTSQICPFAANLIAILYKCSDGFKIIFYNNEKIVKFPGCKDKICPMEKFQELLSQRIATDCSSGNSTYKRWSIVEFVLIGFMALSTRYFLK